MPLTVADGATRRLDGDGGLASGRRQVYPDAVRTLHAILMLIGALAFLGLGAAALPAGATGAPPACHMQATPPGHPAPASAPDDAMTVMNCCIACAVAPDPAPVVRAGIAAAAPSPGRPAPVLPTGRSPAPEPGPPRAAVS